MKAQQPDDIPIMDYAQYRKACRLVHECCNYDQGNCLLLDRGMAAYAHSVFRTHCCADGFRLPYCRWITNCMLCCFASREQNAAACVVGFLFRDLTGRNTVRLVLHE